MKPRGNVELMWTGIFGAGVLGVGLVFADAVAPDLVRHPAAPTVASGLVLLAVAVFKVLDRVWFSRNDKKTDSVGERVDLLAGRMDRVVDKLELVHTEVARLPSIHDEQRAVLERLARVQSRQEKQERDLKVLHDWRREQEVKKP